MMVTEGTEPSNFLHKVEFDLHIYLFFSGKRNLHFTVHNSCPILINNYSLDVVFSS